MTDHQIHLLTAIASCHDTNKSGWEAQSLTEGWGAATQLGLWVLGQRTCWGHLRGREGGMRGRPAHPGMGPGSLLPNICHLGHIFWAAGRRPGCPPAFLAGSAHDLIPAGSCPRGEALPHSADEDMEAGGNGVLSPGALRGPRPQWGGGMWSWRPLHAVQSGLNTPSILSPPFIDSGRLAS